MSGNNALSASEEVETVAEAVVVSETLMSAASGPSVGSQKQQQGKQDEHRQGQGAQQQTGQVQQSQQTQGQQQQEEKKEEKKKVETETIKSLVPRLSEKEKLFAQRDRLRRELQLLHSANSPQESCKEVVEFVTTAYEPLLDTEGNQWNANANAGCCGCVVL